MKTMNLYSLISLIFFSLGYKAQANDGMIRIPLNTCSKPAGDLMDEKKTLLYYGDLIGRYGKYKGGRYQSTVDGEFCQGLDKYSPVENKFWQNQKYSAIDPALHAQMPSQDETVEFDDYLGAVRELGIFSIYIKPLNKPNVRYGLTMGLQVHASLLKSALLRKAGFFQESPKYLKRVRIKFANNAQMSEFVDKAFCEQGPSEKALDCLSLDPTKRGFISEKNEQNSSLVLHGVYVEKMSAEIPSLIDGLTPATGDDLPYYAQSRAFRALAVPFVIGDAMESLNRFSPQAVSVRGGWAQMNFSESVYFDLLTAHDDMKWALSRYAALDVKDWDEIIAAGQYPACTVPLVKSLVLHRYRNQLETFMGRDYANRALAAKGIAIQKVRKINTFFPDGKPCVKDGKVVTEEIPGYPQRFSHGPRQSPFETVDLLRYMKIATQSAVLQNGLDQLSAKLLKQKPLKQEVNGYEVGPQGFRLLGNVTDAFLGANFNANRMVTTGTFYGSQAPIQLVDTVSVSVGIGAQNIFEGLNGITRMAGASASYIRSFTHALPLDFVPIEGLHPLKQAGEQKWKDLLFQESRLKKLASPLKDGNLATFLLNLKVGEVFTITDSIGRGGSVGWTSGLDALSFGYVEGLSAGLSFDVSRQIVLRQIQFSRSKEGLQVFVRDVDSHMRDANGKKKPNHDQKTDVYGVAFDFNYFVNLFKIRAQRSKADLHTDAFLIKYNPRLIDDVNKGEIVPDEEMQVEVDKLLEYGSKAAAALRALIFQSSVDPLYANFRASQFEIDHKLNINELQTKLLWYRATSLDQHHEIKILKTEVPKKKEITYDANGNEVVKEVDINQRLHFVSDRKGELRGRDFFGSGLEVLNYYLMRKFQKNAPQYQAGGSNPSMLPFGFAQWKTIRADSEVTRNREGGLPSVAVIEHTWGGWSMKRQQMDTILGELKEKMKNIRIADFPLIPDGALGNVDKVDFFKVNSHLSILPEAVTQIRDLILAPEAKDTKVPKAKFVARLFQKLSQLGSNNRARGQDMAVYNNLMMLMGDGDAKKGEANYLAQCKASKTKDNDGGVTHTYTWSKGTGYECLESWVEKLIRLSRKYSETNIVKQNEWMSEVLYVLEEQIPLPYLLNYLGKEKFIYYVEVVGFRAGDEDGDNGYYVSNSYGEPPNEEALRYVDGLFSVIAEKTKITPVEFNKGGFQ